MTKSENMYKRGVQGKQSCWTNQEYIFVLHFWKELLIIKFTHKKQTLLALFCWLHIRTAQDGCLTEDPYHHRILNLGLELTLCYPLEGWRHRYWGRISTDTLAFILNPTAFDGSSALVRRWNHCYIFIGTNISKRKNV